MSTTMRGSLGVDIKQIIAISGSSMYKSNICNTAVKELAQNGFDAIKIAKSMDPSLNGKLEITCDPSARTICVKDNGIGMTPEIVLKAFFTIGGSYKGDNVDNRLKSGGLGMAKVAFLFSSEWVEVSTVRDGKKTYIKGTPDEILEGFNLSICDTDEPNGSVITVKIPRIYTDANGDSKTIWFDSHCNFLDKPMIGDIELVVNGRSYYKKDVPSEYIFLGTATSNFGDLDIYIAPGSYSNIEYEVLISGLYQFSKTIWTSSNSKCIKAIINILPTVGVKSSHYPINNQREGFRSTCSAEIEDLQELLERIQKAFERGRYAASFNSCLSMDVRKLSENKRIPYAGEILKQAIAEVTHEVLPDSDGFATVLFTMAALHENIKKSSLDTSGVNIPDQGMVDTSSFDINKPIFHNNTTMSIDSDAKPFLDEFGAMLLELKDLYMQTYEGVKRDMGSCYEDVVVSDRLKVQYWGISFDKNYLGCNVNPQLFNFLGINPFGFALPEYAGVDQTLIVTEHLVHAIIHEFNHNFSQGEGDTFTRALITTEAEFTGIGRLYKEWKAKLYRLVKRNLELMNQYHAKYSSASNKAESLV